jgi:transcriptional regulator with XRE-family HTH domain
MGNALDKLNKLASDKVSTWKEEAIERQNNSEWTERSFKIAVKILREIRTQKSQNGMTQKKLAEEMGVTPQYINKVVKGKENLTLETISKIESVLGITLIEIPTYDKPRVISFESSCMKTPLSRVDAIQISNDIMSYSNKGFAEATGTDG